MPAGQPSASAAPRVHPRIEQLAAYSWRLIVIAIVGLAGLWLLQRLRVVVAPVVIALMISRALAPVTRWLRGHRWRPALAAAATMVGFFLVLAALIALIAPAVADEVDSLGPTLTQAVDDIEDWAVDDSPFNVDRDTVDRLRARAGARIDGLLRVEDGAVVDGATLAAEVVTVMLLSVFLTFFMLRDGDRFAAWLYGRAGPLREPRLREAGERAWAALGGYLRGVLILGAVEGTAIGVALWLAGGGLVAPVAILTFLCAFVPVVGAIVAGLVAVLVALVTGGLGAAVAVAIVALVVQQLDNDLLAPVIYGKALHLHPVVVLLSVVAGGALFGLAGTILAVPVVAVTVNVVKALRSTSAASRLTVEPAPLGSD